MNQPEFEREYRGECVIDEEYQALLNLWLEYRKQTSHLPASREAFKIHRSLFSDIPRNEKYQQAKMESLRIIEEHTQQSVQAVRYTSKGGSK